MGYFQLKDPVETKPYPFDFHSHFNGILPLESDLECTKEALDIKAGADDKAEEIKIEKGNELSILG